ncbi:MAG: formylglycine-generating enzyme family protein [Candidatus Krumholzibacteriota bacterium]|nr:formylglycine-generating enzyme family protein [Candidatus Krumholzibacteriota bacterium]
MKILLLQLISLFLLVGCGSSSPDFILVEGGGFEMGNSYPGGDDDERPVHNVELDPFYIGKTELTVREFREFIKATGYVTTAEEKGWASDFAGDKVEKIPGACWKKVGFAQDDSHPVVCVSWLDAIAYCNWRSEKEGLSPCYSGEGDSVRCDFGADGYRLPTEAEWEYMARSRGKRIKYAWGDGEPYINGRPAGNTKDEAARREWGVKKYWEGYDDGYACTSPAGHFAPNELGVHDISGNVYEWCWDRYGEDYYQYSPVRNPTGPARGEMHSCRDVGFGCPVYQECVASRGKGKPDLTFSWGGFRLARSRP